MGYTHHWRISDTTEWLKTWPQLIADAHRIIETTDVPLIHAMALETFHDPPHVDVKSGIFFNGANKQCETFVLRPEATELSFCKTARNGYDEVVTAILLRADVLAGHVIEVRSDGLWEDWKAGRALCLKIWPDDELECPWPEGDSSEEETDSDDV